MNEHIKEIGRQAGLVFIEDGVYGQRWYSGKCGLDASEYEKLVELIQEDMYRNVLASILITDVVMEEKGQTPTSEDYIRAIVKDLGVEE
jgi:predicted metal-dependent phosphoesterase TrpH